MQECVTTIGNSFSVNNNNIKNIKWMNEWMNFKAMMYPTSRV